MSKSTDDLKAGFAGESQANRRYLAFAKRAEEEGHPQAAKLFRAAAHAETVHALNHLKALGEIKSTSENLEAAAQGENYEAVTMYPGFVRDAEADGNRQALRSFQYALAVEKVHESSTEKPSRHWGRKPPTKTTTCVRSAAIPTTATRQRSAQCAQRLAQSSSGSARPKHQDRLRHRLHVQLL